MGMTGAAVIAGVLGRVTGQTNPVWALPVITSGFVCFIGFLAPARWTMRSAIGNAPWPLMTGGIYLTPLTIALALAALTMIGGLRRRTRIAKVATLRRGTHVHGIVTDDGLAAFAATPNLKITPITVSFRDTSRIERWVTVMATQAPGRPVAVATG